MTSTDTPMPTWEKVGLASGRCFIVLFAVLLCCMPGPYLLSHHGTSWQIFNIGTEIIGVGWFLSIVISFLLLFTGYRERSYLEWEAARNAEQAPAAHQAEQTQASS